MLCRIQRRYHTWLENSDESLKYLGIAIDIEPKWRKLAVAGDFDDIKALDSGLTRESWARLVD